MDANAAAPARSPSRWVFIGFGLIGLAVAVFGATVIRWQTTAPDGWSVTEGRVIDVVEHPGSDGITWAPVVTYADAAGVGRRVVSGVSSSSMPALGSTIEVAYDPADSGTARVIGGDASLVWLFTTGFGLVFLAVPAIALAGSLGGRSGRRPLDGYEETERASGTMCFRRARGSVVIGLIFPWLGAAAMLALAWLVVTSGGIGILLAALPVFFAVMLLLGGIAALGRGLDTRALEVDPDGVWLPGLGRCRWDEFAEIRVEEFLSPTGGGSDGAGRGRMARSRRLGFVPRDASLAARRGLAERLSSAMAFAFIRLTTRMTGGVPGEFAPFGVSEADLGSDAFAQLVARVEAYRPPVHGSPTYLATVARR